MKRQQDVGLNLGSSVGDVGDGDAGMGMEMEGWG